MIEGDQSGKEFVVEEGKISKKESGGSLMDFFLECQIKGYTWALEQQRHTEYNELHSYIHFEERCIKGTELEEDPPTESNRMDCWWHWERGVYDAKWLLRHDENLSVGDIAERTGFNVAYIKAEITAGRLLAMKLGKGKTSSYTIYPMDFERWMKNPRRGSRSEN
jgi:hypothetical protein